MNYIEAKVTFDHADAETAGDLIAAVFFDFELQGVVVEDPGLEPIEEWAEDAVARPAAHAVAGYLPQDDRLDSRRRRLENELARLGNHLGLIYRISYRQVDEQDWAESWKAFFWPQKISSRIVVKPSWREYSAVPGEIVLEVDPGMAFGTGTHPTTILCTQLIETHLKLEDCFLDIGTGSGILMAAADKLGAKLVCGSDRDGTAVNIAARNLRRNGIDPHCICLVEGLLADAFKARFDIIAANILTQVIVDLLDDIPRVLKQNGIFICSGIIDANKDLVIGKMKDMGFNALDIRHREGWVGIASRLNID